MRFLPWATAGLLLAVAVASAQEQKYGVRRARPTPYWNYERSSYDPTVADEPAPMPPADAPQPADASLDGHGHKGCDSCYGQALSSECCDCAPACCCPWYGSLAGLVMTRDRGNELFTTYDANNINNQLVNSQDAEEDWRGGFEIAVGRRFGCCCRNAIEIRYWTLDELEGSTSIRRTDDSLSTPLNVGFMTINGNPAGDYFDNAREHRVSRSSDFHNLEINLIRYPMMSRCESLQLSFLGGVRYFRFDDDLTFASVAGGSEFGDNGGLDKAYLNVDVENNLVGVQIGARAEYRAGCRVTLFAAPEVGIYGNHIRNRASIYDGAGNLGVGTIPAPGTGTVDFPLEASKNDVAILAQIDLGAEYKVNSNWRVFGGYRVVAVTGVALSDNQVPQILIDAPEWQAVDSNGSLILHGLFAGVECRY